MRLLRSSRKKASEFAASQHDLHHTIIVHNHNADLMVDHKAAIEKIQGMIEAGWSHRALCWSFAAHGHQRIPRV